MYVSLKTIFKDLSWVLNQFASPCFSGLSWSIIVGYHVGRFPGRFLFFFFFILLFSLPTCVHVSRCGNVYNNMSQFDYFCIIWDAMFSLFLFLFKHVPCFVILVWLQYNRWVCTVNMGSSLFFGFAMSLLLSSCELGHPATHRYHTWHRSSD